MTDSTLATETSNDTIIPTPESVLGRYSNFGDLILRAGAGLFLVPHGAQKLFGSFGGYGLEATGQFFETQLGFSNGYLAALGAGSVEFFGGILLAAGLFTRSASIAIFIMLAVATSVHVGAGFFWTSGGYEYPLLWALIALSFAVRGGGNYSVDKVLGLKF